MALVTHIIIAFTSIAYVTYLFTTPSKAKFIASYVSVVLTILSGTYLTILNPSHMAEACIAGLLYTGCMLGAIAFARKKFASTLPE